MNDKELVAQHAARLVKNGMTVGLGTGSTADFFIAELARRQQAEGLDVTCVSSSVVSMLKAQKLGLPLVAIEHLTNLDLYVDGADEVDPNRKLIKGGGGALTREKIIAAASKKFVCIVDSTKNVDVLGAFPLPVEVIPMSRNYVANELEKLGGRPVWRKDYYTDNGCEILDVHGLKITDPVKLESIINGITGVVTNGLFAERDADVVLVGNGDKVDTM